MEDEYEGIRIQAINHLDAKDRNVKSKSISVLKKLATSDSKTLVQAAAYQKLNEMGENDLELFKEGSKSQSFIVQAAAAVGVLRIDPSRVSEFMDLPDEVVGSNYRLVVEILRDWVEKNVDSNGVVGADA